MFTAKRYTFMYTRMIARVKQVREQEIVYGNVNENGNEEDSGQQEGAGDSQ